MSVEANKEVVRQWYEDGYGKGDLSAIDEVIASELVIHTNGLEPSQYTDTPEQTKAHIQAWRAAFSDFSCTVDNMIAEGDQVCVQFTFTGIHDNDFVLGSRSFSPTGKRCRVTQIHTVRISEGKVVEGALGSGGFRYLIAMLDGSLFKEQE